MDKVVHFEIPAENIERANKFYSDIFGWKINKVPLVGGEEYCIANTVETDEKGMPKSPGAINGGIMKKGGTGIYPVIVIKVESIRQSIEKIKRSGCKTVMDIVPVGDFGLYARFEDTEGNIMGIWQDVKKE